MVTPARSRRDRKKAAVRAQILAAATELFSRHGIDAVTVDSIAESADIGKGTIYNYFDTKEDIVVAFMIDVERKVQARIHRFAKSNAPLHSILTDFIRFQLRLKRPHYKFVRVFLGQILLRTDQSLPYLLEMQKVIDPPLEALFQTLQSRGLLRKDASVPELIIVFKTIQMGLSILWAVEGPPFRQTEKTLVQEIRLFCQGLEARTS